MPMQIYVYMLHCADKSYYIGIARAGLDKRIGEHQAGYFSAAAPPNAEINGSSTAPAMIRHRLAAGMVQFPFGSDTAFYGPSPSVSRGYLQACRVMNDAARINTLTVHHALLTLDTHIDIPWPTGPDAFEDGRAPCRSAEDALRGGLGGGVLRRLCAAGRAHARGVGTDGIRARGGDAAGDQRDGAQPERHRRTFRLLRTLPESLEIASS